MDREERTDRFTSIEDRYAGYTVYDQSGDKIGKVDDLFVDENDQPEYIGVKMGFFGTSSTLIPMDIVTADDQSRSLTVSQLKSAVKDGPHFDDDHEITPEYEHQVREYYGLTGSGTTEGRSSGYGDYYGDEQTGVVGPGMREGDTESGEFRGHSADNEGVQQREGSDLADRDELRVQRSEEELRAGTREREAGAMRVRKRVRTDREQIRVPKRREEVSVERVPVEGGIASEAEIGEDEVVVPVTEEEVVVDKRPVVKEELRLTQDVVEDEEVVEEDVRREEIDIDDETTGRRGV